jgi:plasmid stabilization system protein ParE
VSYFLTPEAEIELAEAVDFYLLNASPAVARNFVDRFEEKVRLLVQFPGLGAPTTNGRHLFPLGRYPYSILYPSENVVIRIRAIAHQARRPKYWQSRNP